MANYFDFHYHPMFKKYLSQYETNYPSSRLPEDLLPDITLENDILRLIDKDLLHFLGSQCSFDELKAGDECFGVANIVTLEYAICSATNIFADILRSAIVKPLDSTYFDTIKAGGISYYHLFIKELNLYSILANIGTSRDESRTALINILARSKNKSINFDSYTGTTLALAMEGGHNLNRNMVNSKDLTPDTIEDPGATDAVYADFFANCSETLTPGKSLTQLFHAMWQEEMDLLYVTLTHLTYISELPLASHAYGMKILTHNYFYPSISGLTDAGKEVISAAYEMTVNDRKTPVLIDIKHMSLKSRLDFYAYRKEKGYALPILATHMGVTGLPIAEWINGNRSNDQGLTKFDSGLVVAGMANSEDEGNRTKFHFNPWTINLMDEDIVEVMNSNGMIGISLDSRIIGIIATEKNVEYDSSEYLSKDDLDYLQDNYAVANREDDPDIDAATDVDLDPVGGLNVWERDGLVQIACIAFNIMHILAVSLNQTKTDPWSRIVIGSDYDGLIEPMSSAVDCTGFNANQVAEKLLHLMPTVESSYLHFHPGMEIKILPRDEVGTLDTVALASNIQGILFHNGKNFLRLWYNDEL